MESPEAHHTRNPPRRLRTAETMKTYSAASLGEKVTRGANVSTLGLAMGVQSSLMRHKIEASHRQHRLLMVGDSGVFLDTGPYIRVQGS